MLKLFNYYAYFFDKSRFDGKDLYCTCIVYDYCKVCMSLESTNFWFK